MTASDGRNARAFTWALSVALLLVIAWQWMGMASYAATQNIEFDGGMNLEVAKSVANGEGPRGRYQRAPFYPAGVQSKEPFFLVGAAVYKVAGVGPVQSQVPGLLFLTALLGLIFAVVARATRPLAGLLAVCCVLSIPRLSHYALNGYGEVATMCFGLGAMAVLAWPLRLDTRDWKRPFFAGVLGALAIATKVVGVVQFAAIAGVLVARVLVDAPPGQRLRDLVRACLSFAVGALLPMLLLEAWRLHWLGLDAYKAWWSLQIERIGMQSGATPFRTQSAWHDKVPAHFATLAAEMQRRWWATAALLAVPLVSAAVVLARNVRRPVAAGTRAWLTLGLALVAAAYIPWWLGMVPDDKVWFRYLLIAVIALAILAGMGLADHARAALRAPSAPRRIAHAALAIVIALVFAPFVWRSLHKAPLPATPTEDRQAVEWAAKLVSRLPKDRFVFGWGWYAAPVVQLYSDRPFYDLTDFPIGLLQDKPGYLVADKHTFVVGVIDPVLARYPYRKLMRDNPYAQVYELDFAHPNDPFIAGDPAGALPWVDFADPAGYALAHGYLPYDASVGGRMAWSDSELLLRYGGQSQFAFAAYMAQPHFYLRKGPLRGRIIVEGCPPMPFVFEHAGWKQIYLPLACKPPHGTVRVRMLLDNVFDLAWEKTQQNALLVRSIGFAR